MEENEAGQQRGEKLERLYFLYAVLRKKRLQRTQEHTWHCQNPISAWWAAAPGQTLVLSRTIRKGGCETQGCP